jgi:hypothetical protein
VQSKTSGRAFGPQAPMKQFCNGSIAKAWTDWQWRSAPHFPHKANPKIASHFRLIVIGDASLAQHLRTKRHALSPIMR